MRASFVVLIVLPTMIASPTVTTPPIPEQDFAGRWEMASDDGTSLSVMELETSGTTVAGVVADIERGYFSSRQTIKARFDVRGTLRNSQLEVTLTDASGEMAPFRAVMFRRGEFLILKIGETERGFGRPGRPLVQSAEGSAEAATLVRAVAGKVFASGVQASGRGAFVGRRVRLALCTDGRIEYDVSDVASTPGVDSGGSKARRGTWSVALLAGAPVVRAQWRGTGTSYSLTENFVIRPLPGGRSAIVDGTELPVAGSC